MKSSLACKIRLYKERVKSKVWQFFQAPLRIICICADPESPLPAPKSVLRLNGLPGAVRYPNSSVYGHRATRHPAWALWLSLAIVAPLPGCFVHGKRPTEPEIPTYVCEYDPTVQAWVCTEVVP